MAGRWNGDGGWGRMMALAAAMMVPFLAGCLDSSGVDASGPVGAVGGDGVEAPWNHSWSRELHYLHNTRVEGVLMWVHGDGHRFEVWVPNGTGVLRASLEYGPQFDPSGPAAGSLSLYVTRSPDDDRHAGSYGSGFEADLPVHGLWCINVHGDPSAVNTVAVFTVGVEGVGADPGGLRVRMAGGPDGPCPSVP